MDEGIALTSTHDTFDSLIGKAKRKYRHGQMPIIRLQILVYIYRTVGVTSKEPNSPAFLQYIQFIGLELGYLIGRKIFYREQGVFNDLVFMVDYFYSYPTTNCRDGCCVENSNNVRLNGFPTVSYRIFDVRCFLKIPAEIEMRVHHRMRMTQYLSSQFIIDDGHQCMPDCANILPVY